MRKRSLIAGEVKARWMTKYEELVVMAFPERAGKLDWHTADYLYGEGLSVEAAAQGTIKNLLRLRESGRN